MPQSLYLCRVLYIRRYDASGRRAQCVVENADGRKKRMWLSLYDIPAGTSSRER